MAPEVALHKRYDERVDVYSYGLIVWEMATLKKPFEDLNRQEFFEEVVRAGHRPNLNKKWPSSFCELIERCWSADPALRPSMGEVVSDLEVRKA